MTAETNPSVAGLVKYTGQIYDAATGLYYERARWYDPATGRWQSQDPLGFDAGDANLYRYVANNPTNATDPTGQFGEPTRQDARLAYDIRQNAYWKGEMSAEEYAQLAAQGYNEQDLRFFQEQGFSRDQVAQALTPPPDTTPRQPLLTLNARTTDQVVMEVASKVEEATRPYVIRIEAGLGVMGDVSGITAGGALIAAPEPTTMTKVGGAYLVAVSADSLQAHVRILISGEPTATVLHQAVQAGLTKLGMDEGEAEKAASTVDLGNQVLQAYHGAMSFPEAPGQFASGQILRPLDEMTAGRLNPSNYQFRLNVSPSSLGSNGGNVQLQFRFMAGESGAAPYPDVAPSPVPAQTNTVFRGLAAGEGPAAGLSARAPGAGNSVASHVAGKRASQWISTTTDEAVASGRFGTNGVVEIDLSKVNSGVVDISQGIPGMEGTMLSNWAAKMKEVLIRDYIPPEAIKVR